MTVADFLSAEGVTVAACATPSFDSVIAPSSRLTGPPKFIVTPFSRSTSVALSAVVEDTVTSGIPRYILRFFTK